MGYQTEYRTFTSSNTAIDENRLSSESNSSPKISNTTAVRIIPTSSSTESSLPAVVDDDHHHDINDLTTSSLRDFFTVLALSFHAVFEGLAVGLERDTQDVWTLFAGIKFLLPIITCIYVNIMIFYQIAVATHKYVISFCVGLELFQAETRLLIYSAYMLVFALMSPLGIGIGIVITSTSSESTAYYISIAVLQALAGGTIIYVVVFEVLQRERSKSVSGLAQLFFVILGFCVMMSIELFGNLKTIIILKSTENICFVIAGHDHAGKEEEKLASNYNSTIVP